MYFILTVFSLHPVPSLLLPMNSIRGQERKMRYVTFYGKIQYFGVVSSQVTHKFNIAAKMFQQFFIKLTKLSKRYIKKCKSRQDNF